jgi:hypothetical protein
MNTNALSPELLHKMDAYWHATNYLSVGQIYLYDNPLLKRPLTLAAGALRVGRGAYTRRGRSTDGCKHGDRGDQCADAEIEEINNR